MIKGEYYPEDPKFTRDFHKYTNKYVIQPTQSILSIIIYSSQNYENKKFYSYPEQDPRLDVDGKEYLKCVGKCVCGYDSCGRGW